MCRYISFYEQLKYFVFSWVEHEKSFINSGQISLDWETRNDTMNYTPKQGYTARPCHVISNNVDFWHE